MRKASLYTKKAVLEVMETKSIKVKKGYTIKRGKVKVRVATLDKENHKEIVRTGKPVYFEVVGFIDGDNYNEVKMFCPELLDDFGELGLITIYRVAYPDGTIKEEAVPSY